MPYINRDTVDFVLGNIMDAYRTDYSGRGMYGSTCVAVEYEQGHEWDVFNALREELPIWEEDSPEYNLVEAMLDNKPETDSMGLGMIMYWPRVKSEG